MKLFNYYGYIKLVRGTYICNTIQFVLLVTLIFSSLSYSQTTKHKEVFRIDAEECSKIAQNRIRKITELYFTRNGKEWILTETVPVIKEYDLTGKLWKISNMDTVVHLLRHGSLKRVPTQYFFYDSTGRIFASSAGDFHNKYFNNATNQIEQIITTISAGDTIGFRNFSYNSSGMLETETLFLRNSNSGNVFSYDLQEYTAETEIYSYSNGKFISLEYKYEYREPPMVGVKIYKSKNNGNSELILDSYKSTAENCYVEINYNKSHLDFITQDFSDSSGRITKTVMTRSNGDTVKNIIFVYEKNKLIRDITSYPQHINNDTQEYRYDNSGLTDEIDFFIGSELYRKVIYKYEYYK